jgi:4-carboxymuconolactone decarboxylase
MTTRFLALLPLASALLFAQSTTLPADIDPHSYSRLPLIQRDQLDADGQRMYDRVNLGQATPRLGPPAASLYSPGVAEPLDALNQYLRKTVVGPQFFEIGALVAAREFEQQYEWTAHEMAAQRAHVDQKVIDTIKFNRPVDGLPEKEATAIRFGRDLLREHKVSPALYAKVVDMFGRQGMIELATIVGDYALAAVILNAVDQHLPPDRKPLLPMK